MKIFVTSLWAIFLLSQFSLLFNTISKLIATQSPTGARKSLFCTPVRLSFNCSDEFSQNAKNSSPQLNLKRTGVQNKSFYGLYGALGGKMFQNRVEQLWKLW
jgi:hypothetical protein